MFKKTIHSYISKSENIISYFNSSDLMMNWNGIRQLDDENYLMVGQNIDKKGVVYIGPVNGKGFYSNLKIPIEKTSINKIHIDKIHVDKIHVNKIKRSSIYSGEHLENKIFRLVGSYSNSEFSTVGIMSFIYTGKISQKEFANINNYIFIEPPLGQFNIVFHSISNKLIVANSDITIGSFNKQGLIYDLNKQIITSVKYPNSLYTNVYGIWYNSDLNNYTIVGGYTESIYPTVINILSNKLIFFEKGFIVDYDFNNNIFSNWTTIELIEPSIK